MANYFFVTTKRLSNALVVENYLFRKDKLLNTKRYWKCNTQGCSATALTDGNVLIRASDIDSHDHVDDSLEIQRREFKEDVKTTVSDTVLSNNSYSYIMAGFLEIGSLHISQLTAPAPS